MDEYDNALSPFLLKFFYSLQLNFPVGSQSLTRQFIKKGIILIINSVCQSCRFSSALVLFHNGLG